VNWLNIDSIRAEWPQRSLNPAADTQNYQRAVALYERDDYGAMMACATWFATALAHSLYGPGIVAGDDLAQTVHRTLYCALCRPSDGQTFAESAQKAARLAMTIMRENRWQPASLGGATPLSEAMIMDKGNHLLLTAAIAPAGQPWAGDLKAFFAVPHASSVYMDGIALAGRGDYEGALAKYAEAATLGSADAMASAGDLTSELGGRDQSRFWYERAANAGHPIGMFNTAITAIQNGDRGTAVQWLQRSAEAGNAEGYAALTQLAQEAGDDAAEAHWAPWGRGGAALPHGAPRAAACAGRGQ
jgi:hypothetical protein